MRGKQSADPEPENENGITPADAGKTVPSSTRFAYATDHPRGCGENFEQVIDVKQVAGSPPRMRGKQDRPEVIDRRTGITPADAGKTNLAKVIQIINMDHPRGCGENPSIRHPAGAGRWITPADAGKTSTCICGWYVSVDHPRGCGENLWRPRSFIVSLGSPPRMRGKHPKHQGEKT